MSRQDPFGEGAPAAAARKRRSLAIALLLVVFVALVFAVTYVRLTENREASGGNPAGVVRP